MKNEQNNKELESLTKRIHFKSLPFDEKHMFDRLVDRVKRPVVISYADRGNCAWKYLSIAASIALLVVTSIFLIDKEPERALVYYETTAVPDAKTKITGNYISLYTIFTKITLHYEIIRKDVFVDMVICFLFFLRSVSMIGIMITIKHYKIEHTLKYKSYNPCFIEHLKLISC